MIYTQLTNKAMQIAYKAHDGQVDKAGMPYIFHPFHLAEQMDDEISTCVALLHDVIEDTQITFEDLIPEFPEEVIEALRYLTHEEHVPYFEYVQNVRKNEIAVKVKLADIEHNSNHDRFSGIEMDEVRLNYWNHKYSKAKEILLKK